MDDDGREDLGRMIKVTESESFERQEMQLELNLIRMIEVISDERLMRTLKYFKRETKQNLSPGVIIF